MFPKYSTYALASIPLYGAIGLVVTSTLPLGVGLIFLLLVLYPGRFISTFVHELGHAIAARAVGWRLIIFSVRPLAWHLANSEFVVTRAKFAEGGVIGGYVLAVPNQLSASCWWRKIIYYAGGPVASLGLALGLIAATRLEHLGITVSVAALALATISLWTFVGTIVAESLAGRSTDGSKMAQAFVARSSFSNADPLSYISTLLSYRVRLRDLPQWMLEAAQSAEIGTDDGMRAIESLRISTSLDAEAVDSAKSRFLIEEFSKKFGSNDWLVACEVYLAAIIEHDPPSAESALVQLTGEGGVPELTLAAKASVAAIRGNNDLASVYLDQMDEAVAIGSPFKNLTFRDIRSAIETAAAQAEGS